MLNKHTCPFFFPSSPPPWQPFNQISSTEPQVQRLFECLFSWFFPRMARELIHCIKWAPQDSRTKFSLGGQVSSGSMNSHSYTGLMHLFIHLVQNTTHAESPKQARRWGLRFSHQPFQHHVALNPAPTLQGQLWVPPGEAFWTLALTLPPLTPIPATYTATPDLHAHIAAISETHPCCLGSLCMAWTVPGSQGCLINPGICHAHLPWSCPGVEEMARESMEALNPPPWASLNPFAIAEVERVCPWLGSGRKAFG